MERNDWGQGFGPWQDVATFADHGPAAVVVEVLNQEEERRRVD